MTTRRDFFKRSSIVLAGGLIFGDAALEAFERLTHRKVFALGGLPEPKLWHGMVGASYPQWEAAPVAGGPLTAKMARDMMDRIASQTYRRYDYNPYYGTS